MYELIVKILGETVSRTFTIEDLKEMKEILKDIQTTEVRLRHIEESKGKSLKNN